jgi:hypothetical protein
VFARCYESGTLAAPALEVVRCAVVAALIDDLGFRDIAEPCDGFCGGQIVSSTFVSLYFGIKQDYKFQNIFSHCFLLLAVGVRDF